jgi:predicted nucleic acid-binding protein
MVSLLHARRNGLELVGALRRRGENLFITPHVVFELYRGVRRSGDSVSENRLVSRFIEKFRVLQFEREAALLAARMSEHLDEVGLQIPELDLFIAASAVVWGDGVIVTADTRHFRRLTRFGVVTRQA